jgi:hypothetical protein
MWTSFFITVIGTALTTDIGTGVQAITVRGITLAWREFLGTSLICRLIIGEAILIIPVFLTVMCTATGTAGNGKNTGTRGSGNTTRMNGSKSTTNKDVIIDELAQKKTKPSDH